MSDTVTRLIRDAKREVRQIWKFLHQEFADVLYLFG